MFQKVGGWLGDKTGSFTRAGSEPNGGYYASSEAEQAYGKLGDASGEPAEAQGTENETGRSKSLDPFDRAGKDYGGRTPYRSRRDIEEQQAAMEAERQRMMRGGQQKSANAAPHMQPMQPMGQMPGGATGQMPPMAQQGRPAAPQQQQPGQAPFQAPQQQQQRPAQQAPMGGANVVQFPGMQQQQRAPGQAPYMHTEYIVLLRNRNECKNVIEYIKANASVFLNMEFIASDSERQRCVDMLSGAAYTLGCMLTKISPRGIYLISSPLVHVMVDPALQKFTTAPEAQGFTRQGYEGGGYPAQRAPGMQQAQGFARSPHEAQQNQGASRFSAIASSFSGQNAAMQGQLGGIGSPVAGNITASYPAVTPLQRTGTQGAGQYAAASGGYRQS